MVGVFFFQLRLAIDLSLHWQLTMIRTRWYNAPSPGLGDIGAVLQLRSAGLFTSVVAGQLMVHGNHVIMPAPLQHSIMHSIRSISFMSQLRRPGRGRAGVYTCTRWHRWWCHCARVCMVGGFLLKVA
jgi:hypothetical protein